MRIQFVGQTGDRVVLDECFVGSTQILTSSGDTKSIENIKIGDMVLSEVEGKLEAHPVIDHAMTGIKPVYKYIFEHGYFIKSIFFIKYTRRTTSILTFK